MLVRPAPRYARRPKVAVAQNVNRGSVLQHLRERFPAAAAHAVVRTPHNRLELYRSDGGGGAGRSTLVGCLSPVPIMPFPAATLPVGGAMPLAEYMEFASANDGGGGGGVAVVVSSAEELTYFVVDAERRFITAPRSAVAMPDALGRLCPGAAFFEAFWRGFGADAAAAAAPVVWHRVEGGMRNGLARAHSAALSPAIPAPPALLACNCTPAGGAAPAAATPRAVLPRTHLGNAKLVTKPETLVRDMQHGRLDVYAAA
jgi:hypothetical protein